MTINTKTEFLNLFEPLRMKIMRFVWLNANTFLYVLDAEIKKQTGLELIGFDCCNVYEWTQQRWGRPSWNNDARYLRVQWKDVEAVWD